MYKGGLARDFRNIRALSRPTKLGLSSCVEAKRLYLEFSQFDLRNLVKMRSSLLLALLPAALCSPTQPSKPAPLLQRRDQTSVLPNKYIVKFKDTSVLTRAESILSTLAVTPEHMFEHVFKGFSGELDQETLEALRNHPDVSLYQ
jgi:hypothetical protein